ncbi:secreted RxLR effector protein 161-like [Primulina huaijiensis]|uniref:secreted RxLR effector protein 161-like n=1 Tax=Primulina huaijiensis TaxID=1492673 RepID=UPI003CC784EA
MPSEKLQKVEPKIYRSLVGSHIYVTHTRPDISFAIGVVSRFMHDPSKVHFTAAKRILRYLLGTKKLGLHYVKDQDNKLVGFTDSEWAGCKDDRKSTSGYIFCLGSKVIAWSSKKQKTIALSSAKAEYIATTEATCETTWLRRILGDLQQVESQPTKIYCDNMSVVAMTKNPVFHARSKHIELRHHFVRELISKEHIQMEFINTDDQVADFLTKAVTVEKFKISSSN